VLRPMSDDDADLDSPIPDSQGSIRLVPLDSSYPWIIIPRHQAPRSFLAHPASAARTLYAAVIDKWGAQARFPLGSLKGAIGEAGEVATETVALLQVCVCGGGERI
jgi:hypothetical protein